MYYFSLHIYYPSIRNILSTKGIFHNPPCKIFLRNSSLKGFHSGQRHPGNPSGLDTHGRSAQR